MIRKSLIDMNTLNIKHALKSLLLLVIALHMVGCGPSAEEKEKREKIKAQMSAPQDPLQNKGIGPVKSLTLGPIDEVMAQEGKELFESLCTACHRIDKKFIGPSPKDILDRRSPEWIMNMILNPQEMVEKDPIAKQLLIEANGAPMANQSLTEEQARKILEYFRTL